MTAVIAESRTTTTAPLRLPGDPDVWVFIAAELLMFGAFFVAYIVNRSGDVALYDSAQRTLDRGLGVFNTLFLISSSWAVASAVAAARQNRLAAVPRWLALGIALGLRLRGGQGGRVHGEDQGRLHHAEQ